MSLWPPIAVVHLEPDVVLKRFRSAEDCELEARWYERLPDFCPELVGVDGPDLITRRHPVAWEVPEWRDADALYELLRAVNSTGVQHRDVHLRNVVLTPEGPRLIDWYTAIHAPGPVSYDLYGERSGLDKPNGHVDYQCWTTPNRWSIREAWGIDVPAPVD